MSFKSGDRVRVYGIQNQNELPFLTGHIVGPIDEPSSWNKVPQVTVTLDIKDSRIMGYTHFIAHPKQCRRIVKRARVWILRGEIPAPQSIKHHCAISGWPERHGPNGDWVEFVEVRKSPASSHKQGGQDGNT